MDILGLQKGLDAGGFWRVWAGVKAAPRTETPQRTCRLNSNFIFKILNFKYFVSSNFEFGSDNNDEKEDLKKKIYRIKSRCFGSAYILCENPDPAFFRKC